MAVALDDSATDARPDSADSTDSTASNSSSGYGGSSSTGLSPAQLAAIQAAGGAAAADAPGNNAQAFFGAYDSSIDNSGQFDPAQEQAIAGQWSYGGNGTWNGAVPGSTVNQWDQDATIAAEGAPSASSGASPTGLPTSTAITGSNPGSSTAGQNGTAPLPINAFGATPSVTPSYASAATVDPNQQYGYLQAEENANAQSLQPTFQAQDQTNQDQLAARGISSSGSAQELTNQLYQGQGATLAGMNAPAIAQQAGYTQGDITQNQSNEQAVNLANAGAGNIASATNAGYYDQALTGNANSYNSYLSTLEQQGYNTGDQAYEAYLGSFGPNSGVTGAYGTAVGQTGSEYGSTLSSAQAAQNAAYGQLFGTAGELATGGASGAAAGAGGSYDPAGTGIGTMDVTDY
jgi:hypothetical protein